MNEFDGDLTGPGDPLRTGSTAKTIGDVSVAALQARDSLDEATAAGRRFSGVLLTAFEGVAFKGKNVSDVFKSVALSLSQMVLKAATAPLEQGLGNLFAGLFQGGLGFARGGVFQQGNVVPFAQGGVIASPIAFPLSGGMTGIAGERGAEAILPLTRGRDGRLGVAASGGGSGGITINISTPDVESFRRSEGQVAAMIARAAAMGQRNL